MPRPNQTILALDPGTRELGYAVLRGDELLDSGVLSIRHLPHRERLGAVRRAMERWLRAVSPQALVVENLPGRPLDAGGGLPALGRLFRRFARAHDLPFASYSAKAVRRTLLSNGWAGKAAAVEPLVVRFPQLRVYRGQNRKWKDRHWYNLFDAVALGLHHQAITKPPSRSR